MKYYCKTCESEYRTEQFDLEHPMGECLICNDCHNLLIIPKYETPKQYQQRTGKPYSDDGLVFFNFKIADKNKFEWSSDNYDYAKWYINNHPQQEHIIVIADPPVPPPDDWRPEA